MSKKLNAKDFILIGVLTALMWIICMIISTIMSVAGPVTNVFYPAVVAVPNGIVMMLLLAKVPKKGLHNLRHDTGYLIPAGRRVLVYSHFPDCRRTYL
ncbi:MptD family putative ECF transporter S component [Eisenbergiella tayi]|uniref:MptD family putative ECF transporter S component n=1 Tax=Eisenbergiella tayi TaxID=1432052 RepID=UPI0004B071DC|nr:MptD family putative ECF transporter S component [Eisenbergiella tayi]